MRGPSRRRLAAAAALAGALASSAAAQESPTQESPAPATTAPARDTVVVIQRDTLVVIRRDTVFLQPEAPARVEYEETPYGTRPRRVGEPGAAPAPPTAEERRAEVARARAERRERLEAYRREREAEIAALPQVRATEASWAVLLYPTRLLEVDFPAVTAGVTYVRRGRLGAMASLGLLTRPIWDNGAGEVPEGRAPLRGLDLGAEFRYYTSPLYRTFAMYVGGGASFSFAPVAYRRFIPSADGTFERLSAADATGRRIRVNALIGWEYRGGGVAVDLTTGLEYNGRGIFTDDARLAREIDDEFFNVNSANVYNPALTPVIRVGVGIGKW